MSYIHINTINDLLPFVSREEIRHFNHDNGTQSFVYMIGTPTLFTGENSQHEIECRGIVFHGNGNIAARPLTKFFNINERADTQYGDLLKKKISLVMTKLDGSMIYPVVLDNKVQLRSKKSFSSDVAIAAQNFIKHKPQYTKMMLELHQQHYTPVFEYTSPSARIVCSYSSSNLVLLAVRHNHTGQYLAHHQLVELGVAYDIPVVQALPYEDLAELMALAKDDTKTINLEGWVIWFDDGQIVKLKTKWYMDRHHVLSFPTERMIAKLILDDQLDDHLAMLKDTYGEDDEGYKKDLVQITEIAKKISHELCELADTTDKMVALLREKFNNTKDVALYLTKNNISAPHFGFIMSKFKGQEPDYPKYYKANLLKERWTNKQLPSCMFGEAE